MDIEQLYNLVNLVISPWVLVGLSAFMLVLAVILGRLWRLAAISVVGAAALAVGTVYVFIGLRLLTDVFELRVSVRLAVFLLLLATNILLLASLRQARRNLDQTRKPPAGGHDNGRDD